MLCETDPIGRAFLALAYARQERTHWVLLSCFFAFMIAMSVIAVPSL